MESKSGNLFVGFLFGAIVAAIVSYFVWPVQETANVITPKAVSSEGIEFSVPKKASKDQVVLPKADAVISSPVAVSGNAMVFENQAVVSVLDANGKELGQQAVYIHAEDVSEYGPFLILVSFSKSTTETGKVQIWDTSQKDGSKIVLSEVAVKFK